MLVFFLSHRAVGILSCFVSNVGKEEGKWLHELVFKRVQITVFIYSRALWIFT